jgi:hypothetical protein
MNSKRGPRYVVALRDKLAHRLLDTHTGNLVEFLETPSLEYIGDLCWRHNRAWVGVTRPRSFSHQDWDQMTIRDKDSFWSAEQDGAQFSIALRRLKQLDDAGERLPLHFTLSTGRSIESLCDRVAHLQGELSADLLKLLNDLAVAVAVPEPTTNSYGSCAPVLQAICERLALPLELR